MELGRSHGAGETLVLDQLPVKRVRVQQRLVVEDDVIDADHVVLPQGVVVEVGPALVERQVQRVVGVMVEVGAGGDDPVHEPGRDQWNQAAHAQPGRSERAGDGQADGAVWFQELAGENLADLAQSPRVVAQEGMIDQVGGDFPARDRGGSDPMQTDTFEIAHAHRLSQGWSVNVGCDENRNHARRIAAATTVDQRPSLWPMAVWVTSLVLKITSATFQISRFSSHELLGLNSTPRTVASISAARSSA